MTIFSSGRVKVLPFNRHFDEDEQDKSLKKKLGKELSGVLSWCLEGLWLMKETGFEPPQAVLDATGKYRHGSDKLARFYEEMLVADADGEVRAETVYQEYREWCTHIGQFADAYPAFKQGMEGVAQMAAATGMMDGNAIEVQLCRLRKTSEKIGLAVAGEFDEEE